MDKLRKIQRLDNGQLTTVTMQELKPGDTFVMFEGETEQVGGFYKARELPVCNDGVWGIVVDDDLN